MNDADLARVLAARASNSGGTMSEERWSIERMMTMAHEMGALSARVDANDQAVERMGTRTEESIARHTAHLHGELARIERTIQADRDGVGRKIEASEAKLQTAIVTAIDQSRAKQAVERNAELVTQNKELAAQLTSYQRNNQMLILLAVLGVGLLTFGFENADAIGEIIRGLL